MPKLTMLVGVPASGKSVAAQELVARAGGIAISSDAIERELQAQATQGNGTLKDRNQAVFAAVQDQLMQALQAGQDVVLDARLRAPKYRRPYLELARRHGYDTEALFLNVPFEVAVEQSRNAAHPVSEAAIRRYERYLQIPTYAEAFDRVSVRTSEAVVDEARAYFQEQRSRLLDDPVGLIRELEGDGRLASWLPELHRAIPIDQHNPHHRFTVYEHILKATTTVAGTSLKMVWTMLLHDVGKAYPGIKQFTGVVTQEYGPFRKKERVVIENGADIREGRDSGDVYVVRGERIPKEYVSTNLNGHFYDHENLGAQLAFRVLTRLGYEHDFALEVATLIQFHMTMPRDIEQEQLTTIRKWYRKVGRYAADLMMVRLADHRGK
ncbi:MAG TPA: AAA family ATPase [Bacilli bacterium]|nr:AAA family ATPase [Bacilli bacterium]